MRLPDLPTLRGTVGRKHAQATPCRTGLDMQRAAC